MSKIHEKFGKNRHFWVQFWPFLAKNHRNHENQPNLGQKLGKNNGKFEVKFSKMTKFSQKSAILTPKIAKLGNFAGSVLKSGKIFDKTWRISKNLPFSVEIVIILPIFIILPFGGLIYQKSKFTFPEEKNHFFWLWRPVSLHH